MVPSEGEGDIPSSQRPPLVGEESPVEPSIRALRDMDPSGAVTPVLRAPERNIRAESPVLLASQTIAQEILSDHQVEPTPW